MIETLDILVVTLYLAAIFIMAALSRQKKSSKASFSEQKYLANKSLTFFESLCSIIATEVSALTFLGIPAFAFSKDYSFLTIYLGAIFGRFFIAYLFLPLIYNKGITVYSVMGQNGTIHGQRAVALFYSLNKLLAVGVRLFSGSILIASFFQVSIYLAVGLIAIITFFYTLIGGLKAVVRTDIAQMFLFTGGGLAAHFLIPLHAQTPWSQMIRTAWSSDKMTLIGQAGWEVFFIGVFGGILFDMATHGVDQDFAQRLTANKSMQGAQRAIVLSSVLSIFVAVIFLSVGSLLWSYHLISPTELAADQVFAHFITEYFPTGMRGLMVAGVLAATMSTLDSSINAISATLYEDIILNTKARALIQKYRLDIVMISLLLVIVAFISSTSEGLLEFGLKITSWTAGSLLALFFSSVVWREFTKTKLDAISVFGSYFIGALGVYFNTFIANGPWQLNVYYGFALSTLFLWTKGRVWS